MIVNSEETKSMQHNRKLASTALALVLSASGVAANAQCAPDYSGVTLTAVSQTGPFIASALRMAGDKWQEQTCGTLNIVEIPFGELYPKFITGMSAGTFASNTRRP